MIEIQKIADRPMQCVLVGIANTKQPEDKLTEYLDELSFLAETAGIQAIRRFTQRLDKPLPGTFIGSGKLEELKQFVEDNQIACVIFDDELSPAQLRNIDNIFNPKEHDKKVRVTCPEIG